jgi:hypothetical protein
MRTFIRRANRTEMDRLRAVPHLWKGQYDIIDIPNPPHYKCKTYKAPCIILKETKDYWIVAEIWGVVVKYDKECTLFE